MGVQMADLQSLGVVSIESLVPRPIEPIPNSNELPFEWECPVDPPGIMPRIQNLFDLECMCQDGRTDAEFWQWAAVAAAKDLGVYVAFGEWRAALAHLKARRTSEWSLLQYADADLAICTEVNLFLSRTLEESEMVAKATATKRPKKEPFEDRPLPPPISQADRDEVLRRLCCVTPSAAIHWQGLRGKLPADEEQAYDEIHEYLREIWSTGHSVTAPRAGYASSKMGPPLVWFDQIDSKGSPWLSGDTLVAEVRRVMQLDGDEEPAAINQGEPVELEISDEITQFPIAKMTRSPYQTRQDPPAAWLQEMADTMQRDKQLQPCLVRPNGEIIAGHTRHAAAKLLGWTHLQVRIVTCDDTTACRLVLLENAKRRDLTEREKCEAYGALMDTYTVQGRTQLELAKDLGLSESALSNNLRLRSLPEAIWARHAAGGFSTDQLRKIATYGNRPKFCEGLLNYLYNILGNQPAQPEPHHFKSAYDRGIRAAFRPMGKDAFGEGCQFKPTAEQRKALDIVEVELHGRKTQMAGNVELWNKLNREAKDKKKSSKAGESAADPKQQKAAQKAQDDRRKECRRRAVANCWDNARGCAISTRFQKPKKSDFNLLNRLRMIICETNGRWSKWELKIDDLTADDAAFADKCARDVVEYFADRDELDELEPGLLEELTHWLKVDPVPHWKPTEDLFSYCDEKELKAFADDCDLPPDIKANDLIDELLKKWPAGYVPDQFCLQKKSGK